MTKRSVLSLCAAAMLLLWAGRPASAASAAAFHLMQIEQVIGGVNGDPTAQAIQLRQRALFENLVSLARMRVWDAAGLNPVMVIDFMSDVTNDGCGARVLITSPNFADYMDPVIPADFTMTNLIPESYLAAGSLTFEDDGGFVYWRLCWGGDAYTGPTDMSIFNDDDGDVAPPWPGPLPSEGLQALQFQGPCGALSSTNQNDYALTKGPAVFINNAGDSTTVTGPPEGEVAPLFDVTIIDGDLVSGGLPELASSDDTYFRTTAKVTGKAAETHRLLYQARADTAVQNPGTIDITLEGHIGDVEATVTLFLRNFDTGFFEQVGQFTHVLGVDTTNTINVPNASRFVRPSGRIVLRVKKVVVLPITVGGFPSNDDLLEIRVR